MTNAFAVRAIIQQAIGIVMATQHCTFGGAYVTLRLRAADDEQSLLDTARAVIVSP